MKLDASYRVAIVVIIIIVVVVVLARLFLHGLVPAGVASFFLGLILLLHVRLGVGGPVEIVIVFLHVVVGAPEARRLALLEVPGDQAVAVGLELLLDKAGTGDDVAVLVALDVVVGVLEDVQQLSALEAEPCLAFLATRAAISMVYFRSAAALRLLWLGVQQLAAKHSQPASVTQLAVAHTRAINPLGTQTHALIRSILHSGRSTTSIFSSRSIANPTSHSRRATTSFQLGNSSVANPLIAKKYSLASR